MRDMKIRDMIKRERHYARHENNASKAVMGSQMYKFGSLRQLCVKDSDN